MTNGAFIDLEQGCDALSNLLEAAAHRAGQRFAGLGVIVSNEPRSLPLYPIGPPIELSAASDPITVLGDLAVKAGAHHDGFHILTSALKLVAVSQYFSPPVVTGLEIDRSHLFGGRYLAALFGSMLPGTVATGIATTALGIIIFSNGRVVYRKLL